jgi:hypothetical protein
VVHRPTPSRTANTPRPTEGKGISPAEAASEGEWQSPRVSHLDDDPLPIIAIKMLHGRTGSTLLMQLLATSPEIIFDDRYPAEYRFLSYFRRIAEEMTAPFDQEQHRGVTDFFFSEEFAFAPVPFQTNVLNIGELCDPLVRGMWLACSAAIRHHHPGARYYAEKLAVPVEGLRASVPLRVIELVRDPRDVLCSIRAFTAAGQGDGFGAPDATAQAQFVPVFLDEIEANLEEMLEDDPANLLLRYEEMVEDLHGVADRLGSWLGVELDADQVIVNRPAYQHHITSTSVEASLLRWKRELPAAEAEMITSRLRKTLRRLGYEA